MKKDGLKIDFKMYPAERPERLDTAMKEAIDFFSGENISEERSKLLELITKEDQERLELLKNLHE